MPKTFEATGEVQTHQLDNNTAVVKATLRGAGAGSSDGDFGDPGDPGAGAEITVEFQTEGGETLYLRVGEQGGDGESDVTGDGGWPSGGDGSSVDGSGAGGGGGHSGIRIGEDTESARVAVAGAGGAGSATDDSIDGEDGGDALIPDGEDGDGSDGGEGGSLDAAGAGGGGEDTDGDGMQGGAGEASTGNSGGGAGGGFFGGGGGRANSGGGGGSTWASDDVDVIEELGGVVEADGEIVIEEQLGDVIAPDDVEVIDERDVELDLEWTPADNLHGDGGHRLYRDTEPNVDPDVAELVADLPEDADSYTDTDLDNGTTYYYVIEAYRDGDEPDDDLSNETNGTTTMPTIEQLAATGDELAELLVEWDTDQNTGDIRVEFRETGASTWTGHDLLAFTARESRIVDLLDGKSYDVRVRGETSETTGEWSETVGVTLFPGLDIQFPHVTTDEIEIDWSEPNNPDTTYLLERATAEDIRDPDPIFGEFTTIAESGPTVLDEDVAESERFRYRVTADTGDATTTDEGGVQADFRFSDNYTAELVLDDADESATIPIKSRDWIQPPGNWRREPSAITTWEGTVPYSPGAENWTRADAHIYFGGELLLSGELLVATSQDSAGETRLEGDDVLIKLTRGGAVDDYQNVEAHDAIEQYADDHLDDWTVNVEPPEDELVDEGLVVQDADTTPDFGDVFSETIEAAEVPFRAVNDGLEVTRSNILINPDADSIDATATLIREDQFVGGFTYQFDESGQTVEAGTVETHHTIPEDEVGIAVRWEPKEDPVAVEVSLVEDGMTAGSFVADPNGIEFDVIWDFADDVDLIDEWTDGDIAPGEYRIEIEALDGSDGDGTAIDLVSIFDRRYHDGATVANGGEFDDELHEPEGHLDGPATHPNPDIGADIASDGFGQSFNIKGATVTTTIDDVSGSQRLQASNDDGQTWLPADGTENNTQTVTADFSGGEPFGTIARGRVRLNAWSPDGTRNDATPRENYAGQRVESWELAIDTNNIAVLDDFAVAGSHFENLQDLCNEAGMVFVPKYDRDNLLLDVFVPGQVTQTADWTRLDFERELDVRAYANRVRVIGARDEETGERLEATAESQPEIDRVGTVVDAPPIVEDDVESEERLRNIARRELSKRVAEDRLGGSVDIVPKPLRPGFAYEVDALDGLEIPLRGVEFRDTREPTGTLEFREPDDLAAAIAGIRTSIRRS